MASPDYFNDSPISDPEQDRFGIDPFARALARSIIELNSPVGAAIALNGAWGIGKSSAVNLIRHHLGGNQNHDALVVVDFKCWWFRGEEALTLAFLQALNGALEKGLGDKARELLPKIGRKLLQAGPVIGPAVNIATGGIWGLLSTGSVDFAKKFFAEGDSVEKIFNQLSEALSRQDKRFLVIIDDMDRLTPDEALQIFRLVKSVGRLPNVMYLLIFDRELAEKAVEARYPSEGPHFLEKIIQASFDLPLPARDDLNNAFLGEIETRCGMSKDSGEIRRFMNIFYDVVSPYLNSPRDLVRLTNSIAISWRPVAGEVNVADFVALEMMRVFEPKLHNAIRTNKDKVCGLDGGNRGRRDNREKMLKFFLESVDVDQHAWAETALARLFPRLENMGYGEGFLERWEAKRLVCIAKHFDTYFRMALGDEALPIASIREFIERCGDKEYVKTTLRHALLSIRKNGKSKVPLFLDEIHTYTDQIARENLEALISGLFEVADEIDLERDHARGFAIGNAHLQIHWIIRKLTLEHCSIDERTAIFLAACREAQLGWLVDFTSSALRDYSPDEPEPLEKCLVTQRASDELRARTITAIENAASNGMLLEHPQLASILFRWRDFSGPDATPVRAWIADQLANDIAAALLARAFTSESWSQGMGMFGLGDRVAMRSTRAAVDGLTSIMDVTAFRNRLQDIAASEALAAPYLDYVRVFLDAWSEREQEGHSARRRRSV
jgi:predicted KAP-like P-loop ATPase